MSPKMDPNSTQISDNYPEEKSEKSVENDQSIKLCPFLSFRVIDKVVRNAKHYDSDCYETFSTMTQLFSN